MKPSRWIPLASAFAGGAVAFGIYIFRHPEPVRTAASDSPKTKAPAGERCHPYSKPAANHSEENGSQPASMGERQHPVTPDPSPADTTVENRKVGGSPQSGEGAVLSESQWREHAAKVEMAANHELKRLTGLLDLDAAQQDKVFSALARQSRNWLPGMQTGTSAASSTAASSTAASSTAASSTAASSTTNVTASLSATQQQTLVQDEMDRQAWWAEVLPQLLPPDATVASQSGGSNSSTTTPAADTTPAPETKTFDGGDILSE
jgi:hypothetical protein